MKGRVRERISKEIGMGRGCQKWPGMGKEEEECGGEHVLYFL